jgi:hypothetical protein
MKILHFNVKPFEIEKCGKIVKFMKTFENSLCGYCWKLQRYYLIIW